uniref:Putative secreted protein n=1 Tax=Anopheles triannulatus TaxID=58253 RepID=A0A2M4B1V2_9DIPT
MLLLLLFSRFRTLSQTVFPATAAAAAAAAATAATVFCSTVIESRVACNDGVDGLSPGKGAGGEGWQVLAAATVVVGAVMMVCKG